MVKVVLENREVLHGIEDRLSTAVQDVVEGSVSLRSSQKKVLRNKLSQIASCFVQKIKRNTRVAGDDWSDAEDEEPPSKIAKKERLEPEDMVLKAKVETLQAKVKEAAANVKSLRASAPVQIKQKLSASLKQASEGLPTSAAQMQGPSEETKEAKVSAAARDAFVEDAVSIAKRVATLQGSMSEQLARGRHAVKVCQDLTRMPVSGAEAIMSEGAAAKENAGQQSAGTRKAAVARAFASSRN